MDNKYESYKIISTRSHTPQRRETLKGAIGLAERLRKQGKHGTIEGVRYETDENGNVIFDLIRTF